MYLHAVREDPKKKGLLYLGTERGVSYSPDDGATWQPLKLNLPTVAVHDLVVKDDDLVVGTHGRSIWILDDLTPVREWSKDVEAKPSHLFPAPPAGAGATTGPFLAVKGPGQNPPAGAVVHYWLKEKPKGDVTLEILDAKGTLVGGSAAGRWSRRAAGRPRRGRGRGREEAPCRTRRACNAAVWNLPTRGPTKIRAPRSTPATRGGPARAPRQLHGQAHRRRPDATAPVEVRPDPRVEHSGPTSRSSSPSRSSCATT